MAPTAPIPSDPASLAVLQDGTARWQAKERTTRARRGVRPATLPLPLLERMHRAARQVTRWLTHQLRVAMATTLRRGPSLHAHPAALRALIQRTRIALLTTRDSAGRLHSEPVEAAAREFDGEIWLPLRHASPIPARVRSRPAVQVTYVDQRSNRSVILDGIARLCAEAGRDAPPTMLRIDIVSADLWD